MPKQFRKKPVVIEAIQFTDVASAGQILFWIGQHHILDQPQKIAYYDGSKLHIRTLESGEGYHEADINDWIIRGIKGEFYPCKPDIFENSYEEIK